MVADLSVLPALSGDLFPVGAPPAVRRLQVLQDAEGHLVPVRPAARPLTGGTRPQTHITVKRTRYTHWGAWKSPRI